MRDAKIHTWFEYHLSNRGGTKIKANIKLKSDEKKVKV